MNRLLTDDQIQAAFDHLQETGDDIGAAKAMVIRTDYKVKRVYARLFLSAPEGSVEHKKCWVLMHGEYEQATEAHADAEGRWETLKDERNKAQLVLECWRTIESTARSLGRV